MSCNELRDQLVEVACGTEASAEVSKHVESCAACATTLNELRKTMALLDEWEAPEPTPYFDVRLQARLREEKQRAQASWLDWFRKPALGIAAALLIAAGVGLMQYRGSDASNNGGKGPVVKYVAGTAAGDLQFLDRNSDVLQDFDALDALDGSMDNGSEVN
jgi:negative regulator of sigma E activity